ncbi:hypothetical protein [Hymenobacter swuensis]|uniref:Lipoprotein n=1 Tax=Hymenobacter swuensis DY53 TaxID=1227739 RepID=W8EVJ5_9BACT|nr:hypothetical protein [Hymenobacter swuensis]AHJ96538.1 hypothetical protein Hsw_0943 [Hymenobacter swuensis DY53]
MQNLVRTLLGGSMLLLAACRPDVQELVQQPQVGDVYVVQFQPPGSPQPQFYVYRVQTVRPDAVDLAAARQPLPAPPTTPPAPAIFSTTITETYTRAEARELLHEQPGDVNHARLIEVLR